MQKIEKNSDSSDDSDLKIEEEYFVRFNSKRILDHRAEQQAKKDKLMREERMRRFAELKRLALLEGRKQELVLLQKKAMLKVFDDKVSKL